MNKFQTKKEQTQTTWNINMVQNLYKIITNVILVRVELLNILLLLFLSQLLLSLSLFPCLFSDESVLDLSLPLDVLDELLLLVISILVSVELVLDLLLSSSKIINLDLVILLLGFDDRLQILQDLILLLLAVVDVGFKLIDFLLEKLSLIDEDLKLRGDFLSLGLDLFEFFLNSLKGT